MARGSSNQVYPTVIDVKSMAKNTAAPTDAALNKVTDQVQSNENVTRAVLWVGVISLISVIVTVTSMVVDQFYFNQQTYKDQSGLNELRYQELNKRIESIDTKLDSVKK